MEMSLNSFKLPKPKIENLPSKELAIIKDELNYDYNAERKETLIKLEKFNIEQKEFFHAVMSGINGDGGLFCLDAPGGTGKTFVLGALLSAV